MATIVEASVPAAQFALADAFEVVPDLAVESVPLVAHGSGRPLPFVRATAPDPSGLDSALEADDTVARVERLTRRGVWPLFSVSWRGSARRLLGVFVEEGGALVHARGRDGRWDLRLLFPGDDATSVTYDRCRDLGVELSVRRVRRSSLGSDGAGLSERQREALAAAFETDYYGVPRGMTLEGLARELGVSHQALSERLRRGHRTLVANTLGEEAVEVPRQSVSGRL